MKLPAPEGYTISVSYEHRAHPVGEGEIGYVVLRLMHDYKYLAEQAGMTEAEAMRSVSGYFPVEVERKVFVGDLDETGIVETVRVQAADMVAQFERENEIRAALQRHFG